MLVLLLIATRIKCAKIKKLINLVPRPTPGAKVEVLGTRFNVSRTKRRHREKRNDKADL